MIELDMSKKQRIKEETMIRLAKAADLDDILGIYQTAREFMRQNNNANQWGADYPPRAMLENDISKKQLYVCVSGNDIYGVFAFITGEDPTYRHIENGSWKYNGPYGTIHRIASAGTVKGVFSECLEYCKGKINHIRADTHEDNLMMQHQFIKHGFEKRGRIYLANGSPRIAYELIFRPCSGV
jgi:L-amino acid N-acyltransferase YncA